MDVIGSFVVSVPINLPRDAAMRAANIHWVKDATVNEMRGRRMVGKYDDHPNYPKLQAVHRKIAATQIVKVRVDLMEDGSVRIVTAPTPKKAAAMKPLKEIFMESDRPSDAPVEEIEFDAEAFEKKFVQKPFPKL